MHLEVRYKETPNYLLAIFDGPWEEFDTKQEIEALREETLKRGKTRLLLDVRNLGSPKDEKIRFTTGEHIAKFWRYPLKVAAFANAEQITGVPETVAVNRGAVFAVFPEEAAALEWLMKEQ